jgi:leukotriene-A4 hydrolase
MPTRDPNTLSNYGAWLTKHTTANFKIDFQDKCLKGSVILELESLTDKESREIILDSSFLAISAVNVNSTQSKWEVKDRVEPYGSPLHVSVPDGVAKGEVEAQYRSGNYEQMHGSAMADPCPNFQ